MKKSLSSILSIALVFVFAFLAASSSSVKQKLSGIVPSPITTADYTFFDTPPTVGVIDEPEGTTDDPLGALQGKDETTTEQETTTEKATTTKKVTTTRKVTTTKKVTTTRKPTTTKKATTTKKVTTTQKATEPSVYTTHDISDVVECYNIAYETTEDEFSKKSAHAFQLAGDITADGGGSYGAIQDLIEDYLDEGAYMAKGLPGGTLSTNDVHYAYGEADADEIYIYMELYDQHDSYYSSGSGSVSRGIGTVGGVSDVMGLMGLSVVSGADTITVSYTDAYIECLIDSETGEILEGYWCYDMTVALGDVEFNIAAIRINAQDVEIPVTYVAAV